jgi:hypothetical protein
MRINSKLSVGAANRPMGCCVDRDGRLGFGSSRPAVLYA